jgi:hypothetical protein
MWARVAANHGGDDAIALPDKITAQATSNELAKASTLMKAWRNAPCQWAEVFPWATNTS